MSEVIPEAAVEAAAMCMPGYDAHWGGDKTDWAENEAVLSRARQILEAAAPHMLAEAWESGASAQAAAYGMEKDTGPNPYRSATHGDD